MSLKKEHYEKLKAHLGEKVQGKCPLCGQEKWSVHGPIMLQEEKHIDEPPGPRLAIPCASVTCSNCGFVAFINLVVAGVIRSSA